jgi:hypothetical protein
MTTNADRVQRWNLWYERTPELWRFQLIVWTLVIVGAVNMLLTIAVGFPFALLVGIAILLIAAVRVPYALGWVKTEGQDDAAAGSGARFEMEMPSWVIRANRWYDGLNEMQRPLVLLALLAIPGALNRRPQHAADLRRRLPLRPPVPARGARAARHPRVLRGGLAEGVPGSGRRAGGAVRGAPDAADRRPIRRSLARHPGAAAALRRRAGRGGRIPDRQGSPAQLQGPVRAAGAPSPDTPG